MGSLSVSTHRGLLHWQGLLVAVSLFNFWCQPTTAQLAIVSTSIAEGEAALLPLRNTPPEVLAFVWYKGEGTSKNSIIAFLFTFSTYDIKGVAYSGRERITADGSLLIDNVTMNDAGMYTVVVYITDEIKEIGFGRLNVYEPDLVVSLVASNTTVTENKDTVILTCNTNALYIHWLFYGMKLQLNERMKLSTDHRTLTIDPVKREDAGIYWCDVSNPIKSTTSRTVELHVKFE
ncbi:carcinoembryonic antigen-related cell adhesion molecule 21-like [Phyllostomus discolor]|uniref:Carcinoembryonic antigen-related cell adhesion molecule 21-like n=1 Tax=Phyllostomus discolor TaxID=89673 RepID=A0A7E6CPL8_9CHIR|nr:carcinoembryonic antigen-related cell adhesion molecule 21-like [Phyllostomus discolor]